MELQSLKNRFNIIGNAPALNHALHTAMQVAPTDLTVLINGESGVGKEVFSQLIHQLSPRKHNPFIAVNCGAIPEGTIDSELFGHEKGSFTGAHEARKGYFEFVNSGTIFLDEVGELPIGTQARLLRVLETKEFIRVGSSKVQKTDVRVIAATNVNLLDRVQQGKFREDLYYRLSTVPIRVPSLRDRPEDIPVLFRKFSIDFSEKYRTQPIQLDDDAKKILVEYTWPGNVRELKNISEQVSVLAPYKNVTAEVLQRFIPKSQQNQLPMLSPHSAASAVNEMSEREILYKVLFDMRNDLTELKKIVFGMGHVPTNDAITFDQSHPMNIHRNDVPFVIEQHSNSKPIQVEESLSLVEQEKEIITKALKKHHGRRKDAAAELGISERTLYRKIKEYDIAETREKKLR